MFKKLASNLGRIWISSGSASSWQDEPADHVFIYIRTPEQWWNDVPGFLLVNCIFFTLGEYSSSCKTMPSWALASTMSWVSFENGVRLMPRNWELSCYERGISVWGCSRGHNGACVVESPLVDCVFFLPFTGSAVSIWFRNIRVCFLLILEEWSMFQFSWYCITVIDACVNCVYIFPACL